MSQVSVVQKILDLHGSNPDSEAMELVLGQLVQMYEKSAMGFVNNYAYAILGIPSLIFGWMIYRINLAGKITGILLMLNSLTCIIGIAGIIAGDRFLSNGSVVGGILFFFSLIGMTILFWRKSAQ
jgi:hypothetical protein